MVGVFKLTVLLHTKITGIPVPHPEGPVAPDIAGCSLEKTEHRHTAGMLQKV
jgi:hypothetical protein